MINATVIQPPYYCGDNPDEKMAQFLTSELLLCQNNSIIVLPEYSNAGGLSDAQSELNAILRAKSMLDVASKIAKEKNSFVAINVLEKRDAKIKNSTYLFNKKGEIGFIYDKIHLPPSEIDLGVEHGGGACVCEIDGIRFGFLTCYDVYFNEQIEYLAKSKVDVIIIPGYQRGESTDIIRAQTKLIAFRCNAFVLKSSYSMNSEEKGGCSMIVAPNGKILKDLGKEVGSITEQIDVFVKHLRPAGFGKGMIRNDEFINIGLRPEIFDK
jgi:predicted amidohydrolase